MRQQWPAGIARDRHSGCSIRLALNLYNFMDGIDGTREHRGRHADSFGAGLALSHGPTGNRAVGRARPRAGRRERVPRSGTYPPARIFMGDVGSGFLGVTSPAIPSRRIDGHWLLFWAWIILLGVFIVDATYACAALLAANRPHEAHRATRISMRRVGSGDIKPVSLLVGASISYWLCR